MLKKESEMSNSVSILSLWGENFCRIRKVWQKIHSSLVLILVAVNIKQKYCAMHTVEFTIDFSLKSEIT
jgi:hypothetical protein